MGLLPTDLQRHALRSRPRANAIMYQRWQDLLFLHWTMEPEVIQAKLPKGLTVDCYEGHAYLGVVPFLMRNIRFRGTPALPWVSNFLELNLRTYVYDEAGNPGVWFFSLDCNQPLAVWAARTLFHLPYQNASMQARGTSPSQIHYSSTRSSRSRPCGASRFDYVLESETRLAQPGTLDYVLVERYLLFAADRQGKIRTGQVHHEPYPLNRVSVTTCETDLFELNGFQKMQLPYVHSIGSRGVDVEVFPLK